MSFKSCIYYMEFGGTCNITGARCFKLCNNFKEGKMIKKVFSILMTLEHIPLLGKIVSYFEILAFRCFPFPIAEHHCILCRKYYEKLREAEIELYTLIPEFILEG